MTAGRWGQRGVGALAIVGLASVAVFGRHASWWEPPAPAVTPPPRLSVPHDVTLVAVQPHVSIDDYASEAAFEAMIDRQVARVRAEVRPRGPLLVAFPEDIASFLLCAGEGPNVRGAQTLAQAIEVAIRAHPGEAAAAALGYGAGPLAGLYMRRLPRVLAVYINTFSRVARTLGATVVAGSVMAPDVDAGTGRPVSRRVFNTSVTFDPGGRPVSRTKKVHLVPGLEDVAGLSPGTTDWLQPFDWGPLRVSTLICYDGFFADAARTASVQGARIVVQPSANSGAWEGQKDDPRGGRIVQRDEWFRDGLLARVQERLGLDYGINPMLTGDIFDLNFEGQSTIVARRDLTPDGSGFLARALGHDTEEVVWATVTVPPAQSQLALPRSMAPVTGGTR